MTDQEKIKLAKKAFEKYVKRLRELLLGQKSLFDDIMEKIEARKIKECRGKICDVYKKNNH